MPDTRCICQAGFGFNLSCPVHKPQPIRRIQVMFGEPEFIIIMRLAMHGAAMMSEDVVAQINTHRLAKASWDEMSDNDWDNLVAWLHAGAASAFPEATQTRRVIQRD